ARADFKTNDAGRARFNAALGKWLATTNQAMLDGKKLPRRPIDLDPEQNNHNPCVLFNAMILPLVPYAIHGIIWYQGESNGPTARQYRTIMETLIENWRALWGEGDLAFLTTQIAGWGAQSVDPNASHPTAIIRDEQRKTLEVTNTGMAVTIDIGDPANIHPKNKQETARRLALIAKAKVYGETNEFSGPLFESMTVETNAVRLRFTHAESGLTAAGGNLVGFAIAGDDKKFFWGDAKIANNTIVVSSQDVPNPVAIRYSWGAYPMWSLFNKAGLPASPFRTDSW
ncbi:MAG TPA: sialate O-acetylesterase, partial [Verrucomicrobiae bacterium]|nr:sialate O-acetylesterase [Verrucomicrobiae bacterium]